MNQAKILKKNYLISGEIFFYLLVILFSLGLLDIIKMEFLSNYPDLRFLISCLVLLFLPGRVIFNLLYDDQNLELSKKIPGYFIFSLFCASLIVLAGYVFKFGISQALAAYLVIIAALIILDLIKKSKTQTDLDLPKIEWVKFLLWLLIFLVAILSVKLGGFLESDARFHIANIRKLLNDDFINDFNSHFKNFGTYFPYAYSTWNSILAMISKLAGLDPVRVWFRSVIFLVPLTLLSFYSFSATIFKNKKIGLVSVFLILFLLFVDISHNLGRLKANFTLLPFPLGISLYILMPAFFYFVFLYIHKNNWKFLLAILASGLVLLWIHIYYFLLILLMTALFLVWLLIFRRQESQKEIRKTAILLAWLIVFSLPYIILRFTTIDQEAIAAQSVREIYFSQMIKFGNYYILDPKAIFSRTAESIQSKIHMWALIILGFLSILYRHKLWFIFSAAIFIGLLLIVFNPLAINFLLNFLGDNKTWRLYQVLFLPSVLIVSLALYKLIIFFNEQKSLLFKIIFICLIIFGGLNLYKLTKIVVQAYYHQPKFEDIIAKHFDSELIDFIKNNIPRRSQILVPPLASTLLPVYVDQYVFFGPSLSGKMQVKIETDARKMLVDPEKNIDLFKKYRPDYVLVEKESHNYGNLSQFKLLYENGRFKLYQYCIN